MLVWDLVAGPRVLGSCLFCAAFVAGCPWVTPRSLLATDVGHVLPWGLFPDVIWVPGSLPGLSFHFIVACVLVPPTGLTPCG